MKKTNTMKNKEGVLYLKKVMSAEDYMNLLRGSALAQSETIKSGMFISVAQRELAKVKEKVSYLLNHEDSYVRGTTKNILKEAKKNANKGMFDGVFLCD
jgi:hypothetical protein